MTGCLCEKVKPGTDPKGPRRIAVAVDDWKLKRYRSELAKLNYEIEVKPFTGKASIITVLNVQPERVHKDIHTLCQRLEMELRSRN